MTVQAHAKVNATLEVYGKRPDGYHALRSVVLPISLADELEITCSKGLSSDTGYADDLCVKAARVLAAGRSDVGAAIRVRKRIPAGGGLGGGSADAAAVLVALNELWRLGLSRKELAERGALVGSDVPALVLGGPVLMEGRGETVSRIAAPTLHLVLVNPGVHSSTRDVYAACQPRGVGEASATSSMIAALGTGDLRQIAAATMNDLQAPAVRLHPQIAEALDSLHEVGALGVMMSGSGSCVFGFAQDAATAVRMSADLTAQGLQAWAVQTVSSAAANC